MKIDTLFKSSFVMLFALLLVACEESIDTSTTKPILRPVRTQTVDLPAQGFWREFPGVVDAIRKADLAFRVSGKLSKVLVNEGDIVKKNQALAQLDQTDYKIKLKSRQADFEKAQADFKRAKDLVTKGHISRSDYDKLKAQHSTAEANLAEARQNLSYTTLKAPFSGRVAKRHVENYEDVSNKQPVFSLQDISSLIVKVDVPESVMIRINKDAKRKANAYFEAIPDKRFPLSFMEVSTQADESSKTFEVSFRMSSVEGHNILPGMSVTVRGERDTQAESENILVIVPAYAVLEDRQGRYVYIVKAKDKKTGAIQRRNISTGRLSSQGLEILSGLARGDRVVTAGMSKMSEGLIVRIMNGETR